MPAARGIISRRRSRRISHSTHLDSPKRVRTHGKAPISRNDQLKTRYPTMTIELKALSPEEEARYIPFSLLVSEGKLGCGVAGIDKEKSADFLPFAEERLASISRMTPLKPKPAAAGSSPDEAEQIQLKEPYTPRRVPPRMVMDHLDLGQVLSGTTRNKC